jgi:polyhydroxybutyrate depolymerase
VSPGTGLAKDVRFISDLIDDLEKAFNVDPTRIYADGLSNGGGMAFVLSCTLSDRIAAVGMVAAAQSLPWDWCTDRRPVPMIAFHGTADRLVPYEGGTSWVGPVSFPDVSRWTASWARRNRCGPDPVETTVAADVTRRDYTDCADDAAVVLFTIHGGAIRGPAASLCRSGSSEPRAAASTRRVSRGRSFRSIGLRGDARAPGVNRKPRRRSRR